MTIEIIAVLRYGLFGRPWLAG